MSDASHLMNRMGQAAAEDALRAVETNGGPFVAAVEATRMPMAITDPGVLGNPIIYVNAAFIELCACPKEDILGQDYFFLIGRYSDPGVAERVADAMTAHRTFIEDVRFRPKAGVEIWVSLFVSPVIKDGRVIQHFASFLDVTDRVERERELRLAKVTLDRQVASRTKSLQKANSQLEIEAVRRRRTEATLRDALAQGEEDLRYRDFLIREVNHRTKNALMTAISLMGVQARTVESDACRDTLHTAMGRLKRISEVHELLTYRDGDPDKIDFAEYLERLCRDMAASLAPDSKKIAVVLNAEADAIWSPDVAIPLGLVVGEAVTNAFKHAFPGERDGNIHVQLRTLDDGVVRLQVRDDGVGMPAERRKGSLGMRLIDMFARQVRGESSIEAERAGSGTVVTVTFPDPAAAEAKSPVPQPVEVN